MSTVQKNEPLISVIVPIYKVEKYLKKCVDSITNQTYKNIEIILVDDGSPDGCGEICDKYAKSDKRVRVIHKENGGLADARNAGIDSAKGEYIGFIDSDDYIAPEMYERLYKRILEDNSDMAVCPLWYVDECGKDMDNWNNNKNFPDKIYRPEIYLAEMYYYVTAVNKLYKSFLWDDIRFPYGKLNEDAFVEYKIVDKCSIISFVSEPMYYYTQRQSSIMNSEFSIRRLDAAEAYIGRIEYTLNRKMPLAVEKAIYYTISVFKNGYQYLNLKVKSSRKRINELKNKLGRLYLKTIFSRVSMKVKLHLTFFLLNPRLYQNLIKCYASIKRKMKKI